MKKENPIPQNERASFYRSLQSLGLADEFLMLCRAGKTTAELRAWAKPRVGPDVYVPTCFKAIRNQLGAPGRRGGVRPGRGKTLHSLRGLRL